MFCITCGKSFDEDEIDEDDLCYKCSNNDLGYEIDALQMTKELIENAIDRFAEARNTTTKKTKEDLVEEYAHDHPKEYTKQVYEQIEKSITKTEKNKSN